MGLTGNRPPDLPGWLPVLAAWLLLACGPLAADDSPAGRVNAPEQQDKPYLVLVSVDGFRWDFADLYGARHIASIGVNGLRADGLQPVFPTLTFPNHFSIATGQLPARHGLVANEFPHEDRSRWYFYKDRTTVQDGSWYLAEPIWVTAEKHGMLSAAFFFVGTEADVGGVRPTQWRAFDADIGGERRIRQVLDWLNQPPATRPHVVTLYFEDVDDNTHWYGPGSQESRAAILRVDEQVGQLLRGIEALPHGDRVYVFLVSDHGAAAYDEDRAPLVLDEIVDLSGSRAVEGGPYVYLWFDPGQAYRARSMRDRINEGWDCGRALLPGDAPPAWGVTEGGRFPDLIVQADAGCGVITTAGARGKINPGDHGWPPEMPEMKGVFYASGPRIPAGLRLGTLHATDIHALMMAVLELPAADAPGSDGAPPGDILLPGGDE
jgi:alkaline phosphatase D